MPTINIAGIDFDVCREDGSIEDATLIDRKELIETLGEVGEWPASAPDLYNASAREIEEWAIRNFDGEVAEQIDWQLEPLWSQYGCRSPWHAAEGV